MKYRSLHVKRYAFIRVLFKAMENTVTPDVELDSLCCEQPALDSHNDNNNKKGKSNHGSACFRTHNLRPPSPDRIISIIDIGTKILLKLVHSNKT